MAVSQETGFHSTFRVRRYHVSRALNWLKAHNPKCYGSVVIGQSQLDQLPEDDVPDEILGVIRQSNDVGLVDQESSGYVRVDEIGLLSWLYNTAHWNLNHVLTDNPPEIPQGDTRSDSPSHINGV